MTDQEFNSLSAAEFIEKVRGAYATAQAQLGLSPDMMFVAMSKKMYDRLMGLSLIDTTTFPYTMLPDNGVRVSCGVRFSLGVGQLSFELLDA